MATGISSWGRFKPISSHPWVLRIALSRGMLADARTSHLVTVGSSADTIRKKGTYSTGERLDSFVKIISGGDLDSAMSVPWFVACRDWKTDAPAALKHARVHQAGKATRMPRKGRYYCSIVSISNGTAQSDLTPAEKEQCGIIGWE